jgi:hypothetical protein
MSSSLKDLGQITPVRISWRDTAINARQGDMALGEPSANLIANRAPQPA